MTAFHTGTSTTTPFLGTQQSPATHEPLRNPNEISHQKSRSNSSFYSNRPGEFQNPAGPIRLVKNNSPIKEGTVARIFGTGMRTRQVERGTTVEIAKWNFLQTHYSDYISFKLYAESLVDFYGTAVGRGKATQVGRRERFKLHTNF